MLTEIYLIRHGWADRDPAVPYESPPGPGLSARGRYEVREAATFLAGRGIRHLYVSPFRRTHETAEQIAEQLGLPVSIRALLAEMRRDEPADDLRARIREFLAALPLDAPEPIGVVTHASPLLVLRAELCGETADLRPTPGGVPPIPTACVWRAWRDGATWRAEQVFAPSEAGWRQMNLVF